MTQAERIIDRFGTMAALARALGHRHPTTVQGWKQRGFIPSHRHQEVIEAGRREGVGLTPSDFFDYQGLSDDAGSQPGLRSPAIETLGQR